ncbi:hypothetical protein ANN_04734 [Periplaneta americana]|uniref:Uncharacterized protein n=1 Tax=Periplaneta americana TaxID=6978 RepID=A0ABQ8T986_PERAM|nr:hypothetical protein ANN_04734 [Periplaneta americana]
MDVLHLFIACWPLVWWCKSEPLPDEENLIGRFPREKVKTRSAVEAKEESGDDELLRDHKVEPMLSSVEGYQQQSERELEVQLLKEQAKRLENELDREIKQRQEERNLYDESISYYKKVHEETRTAHNSLHEKLDQAMIEKGMLEQQIEKMKEESEKIDPEYQLDRLSKELQRRRQLEDDLKREIDERKKIDANLQQEILKRQQLEQDLRLLGIEKEVVQRDHIEQEQEQEIQRRQLQLVVEQELQKHQELLQQLELEMKQRQELQRKLVKETQERHQAEIRLQEEIQARHKLELEFKQADFQNQILEQELRQELREMKDLLNINEDDDIEVIPVREKDETISDEPSIYSTSDEVNAEDEEVLDVLQGEDGDTSDIGNDDDEKQEIRQLLLEEFQRLQTDNKQKSESSEILNDQTNMDTNRNDQHGEETKFEFNDDKGEISNKQEPRNEDDDAEIISSTQFDINNEFSALITGDNGELDDCESITSENKLDEGGESTEVLLRKADTLLSEDGNHSLTKQFGERRKGILMKYSSSLELEHILEEHDTVDFGKREYRDYSDILGKTVNFQGHDVTIESLVGDINLLETRILLEKFDNEINNGRKLIIGSAFANKIDNYVPRILIRKKYVKTDIFRHKTSKLPTIFAVSGIAKHELQKIIPQGETICQSDENSGIENAGPRFILLNDPNAESDYCNLCKRARNFKAIHWLHKEPDGLVWKKSKGHIDVVRQYTDGTKEENIMSLVNIENNTVILTGSNGEGKSTYLTNSCHEIKHTSPTTWVIRVNLNVYKNYLEKCDLTNTTAIELLSLAAGLGNANSSELEKELLRYSLQVTGKVAVFIDEISYTQIDKIFEWLMILKNMKMYKLVVAVHPHIRRPIENILSTLALTIRPLGREELQMLLKQFWKTDDVSDKAFDDFSSALLHLTGNHFGNDSSPTPLEIKMLAQVFEEAFISFHSSKVIDLPKNFDSIELYESYILWELKSYSDENMGTEKEKESYLEELTYSAMASKFPEETVRELLGDRSESRDGKGVNKLPPLHRTLEDYIVAKWLANNYKNCRPCIREKYFQEEFQTMWTLFDRILAKDCKLHIAVLNKNINRVKELLSDGYIANSLDKGGRTPLHLAVITGNDFDLINGEECTQIVKILIDNGANVSITDDVFQWTALRYADILECWNTINILLKENVNINDLKNTKQKLRNSIFLQETLTNAAVMGLTHLAAYILDIGIDINTPLHSKKYSHQQYSLLHIVSENEHAPLMDFLLENGASVNLGNWENNTPLHLACKLGKTESVIRLLNRNADVNKRNKHGDTSLHEAVRSDQSDIVQILVNNGADINSCNKYDDTPLHVACHENNLTVVSYLLDKRADKNIRNKNGDSPLDCAIRRGHTALVKYILGRGLGCLLSRDRDERTPLHLAAVTGDILMLDYILQVIADVNICTIGGDTPLHLTCLHGKTDAAVFLLKKGADINKVNNYGNTALHLASLRGNVSTLNALLENNATVNVPNVEGNTPLHLASLQGEVQAARYLIKHGADVNIKNRERNIPLQLALVKGEVEIMKVLIQANSDVNAVNRYGETLLHQAAEKDLVDILQLLVSTGKCMLDIRNSHGDTPLINATRCGFVHVVECLILAGADPNVFANDGNVPLHMAVSSENMELTSKLIELGADINIRNLQGNTPLHRAVYANNERIIKLLVEQGCDKGIQNGVGDTPFDVAVHLSRSDAILHIL